MGSPFVSSTFSRTTGQLTRQVFNTDIQRAQQRIQKLNRQISSGKKILQPSDNPLDSDLIQNFTRRTSENETFLDNIQRVKGRLKTTNDSLERAHEISVKSREIATQEANASASAQTRRSSAEEVKQFMEELRSIGNSSFEGRFLFGGDETQSAPFKKVGGTVAFTGSNKILQQQIASGNVNIGSNISAKEAFGAVTKEVEGRNDLDPDLTLSTKLSSLNGGKGVQSGKIRINDDTGSLTEVDLRDAGTIDDVITRIDQVSNVNASISPSGDSIRIEDTSPPNPGGTITVREVNNGSTASDLGILTSPSGSSSPFNGDDLNPELTRQTSFPGGLDPVVDDTGITIRNETPNNTFTANLDFSGASDMGDVIDKINNSGTHVKAKINEERTAINVVNTLQAGRMTIEENGGTTASDLGLETTLGRFPLENLNGGNGVNDVEGDDIAITDRAGNTFGIDISDVDRVEELTGSSGLVANETGGNVELAIDDANNRLIVEDNTGGGGTLQVTNAGGGFAADDLGISGSGATTAPADEIEGESLNPAGFSPDSLFSGLVRLRESLLGNNTSGITQAGKDIEQSGQNLGEAQANVGGRIKRLDMTRTRLEQENKHLGETKSKLEDVDLTEVSTKLQQERQALQATLRTVGQIGDLSLFQFI